MRRETAAEILQLVGTSCQAGNFPHSQLPFQHFGAAVGRALATQCLRQGYAEAVEEFLAALRDQLRLA